MIELLRVSLRDEPDFDLSEQEWAEIDADPAEYRRNPSSATPLSELIQRDFVGSLIVRATPRAASYVVEEDAPLIVQIIHYRRRWPRRPATGASLIDLAYTHSMVS